MTYRSTLRRTFTLAALSLAPALSACDGGTGSEVPPTLSIQGVRTINALGGSLPLTLAATNPDGEVVGTAGATWSSSNTQVATVTASTGVVAGLAVGTTTITARLRGATAVAQVQVQQVPARVLMTAPMDRLAMGQNMLLTPQVLDSLDRPIPGVPLQWSSTLPEVAAVSQTGSVTGVGTGRASITASVAGVRGTRDVSVYYPGYDGWGPDASKVRLSFSPSTLRSTGPDSIVTATVYMEDLGGSGIVRVSFKVGLDASVFSCTLDTPTTGNGQQGTWSCPIRRSQLPAPGIYRFRELSVTDGEGSGFLTVAANLEAFGKQAYFTLEP